MNDGGHNPNAHGGFITADELSYFVKEHIELCIQRCMSLEETEQHIQSNFGIESVVVRRLWRRLEDENQEFFRSYCIRRRLVSVVNRFNDQLERQQELMRETGMLERPNHDAAISGQDQEQEQVQLQLQPQPQPQLILQWLQTQEQVLNQQQQQILQRLQTQTQSHYHQQQTQVLHQPQMPSLDTNGSVPNAAPTAMSGHPFAPAVHWGQGRKEQVQVQVQVQQQPQPQQQILQQLETQTQSHYHQQQTQVLHQPQIPSLDTNGSVPNAAPTAMSGHPFAPAVHWGQQNGRGLHQLPPEALHRRVRSISRPPQIQMQQQRRVMDYRLQRAPKQLFDEVNPNQTKSVARFSHQEPHQNGVIPYQTQSEPKRWHLNGPNPNQDQQPQPQPQDHAAHNSQGQQEQQEASGWKFITVSMETGNANTDGKRHDVAWEDNANAENGNAEEQDNNDT